MMRTVLIGLLVGVSGTWGCAKGMDTGVEVDGGPDQDVAADAALDQGIDTTETPDVELDAPRPDLAERDVDEIDTARDVAADGPPDSGDGGEDDVQTDLPPDVGEDTAPDLPEADLPPCQGDAECDDGDACNGQETCDPTLGCVPGTALSCDDGDVCNGTETCNPALGCTTGTPLVCDDGDVCNGTETCDPALGCTPGTSLVCDNGDVCDGAETCNPALGCTTGTPLVCDDGDACNGVETCAAGSGCAAGTPLDCGPYACSAVGGCLSGCGSDLDCAAGASCVGGVCGAPPWITVAGSFVDISRSGAEVLSVSTLDDGATDALALGFDFEFFGEVHNQIYVGSNGLVGFDASPSSAVNTALPSTDGPGNLIAVFWDDLDPGDGGDVYFQVRGNAPSRRAIVQWKDVDFFAGNSSRLNFELILYETTHQIQFIYGTSTQGDTNPARALGNSATIGLENSNETVGVEIAHDANQAALPGQVTLLTPAAGTYEVEGWTSVDGDFTNIASSGTTASQITSDDGSHLAPLGFNFGFYGETYSEVRISANGYLTFGATASGDFSNADMPSAPLPNAVIAPFWDDLDPTITGAKVVYQVVGVSPWRRFVVQWDKVGRFGSTATGVRLTFEAVLCETSNTVEFHYGPLYYRQPTYFGGASATVGIEDEAGASATKASFNAAAISQGDSVYFLPASAADTSSYTWAGLATPFEDIRDLGTRSGIDGLDDSSEAVDIGFDFAFDGSTFSTITVSTNGLVVFGSAAGASYFSNTTIPTGAAPNGLLAPFWDDHDPGEDGSRGEIYSALVGTAPNRERIVQWQSMPHNLDGSASTTFEIILRESTGDALFTYGGLLTGAGDQALLGSATVGVENLAGTAGSSHGVNQSGSVRGGGHVRVHRLTD